MNVYDMYIVYDMDMIRILICDCSWYVFVCSGGSMAVWHWCKGSGSAELQRVLHGCAPRLACTILELHVFRILGSTVYLFDISTFEFYADNHYVHILYCISRYSTYQNIPRQCNVILFCSIHLAGLDLNIWQFASRKILCKVQIYV